MDRLRYAVRERRRSHDNSDHYNGIIAMKVDTFRRGGAAPSAVAALFLSAVSVPEAVDAQPPPIFRATCGELRSAVSGIDYHDGELVTIEVEGPLEMIHADGGLVYLGVCGPPDPQVLCVTYEVGGREIGETVVLAGAFLPRGPDHIQLDPCLHHAP